jgi:hypothetical protein
MRILRNAALCSCLFISACALGETDLGARSSAAARHGAPAAALAGRLRYVPRPLQPNNCGTPDAFKPCMLAANRPERPTVLVEDLGGRRAELVAPTSSALIDYSRLTVDRVGQQEQGATAVPRHEIEGPAESQNTQ